ncbi:MAG: cysteine-rich CWC family protein [Spongiibacteraceae bacterium]
MPTSADKFCPLCQQPNQCAMAAGEAAESCWCMNKSISKQARQLASAVTDESRCICALCGADTQTSKASDNSQP